MTLFLRNKLKRNDVIEITLKYFDVTEKKSAVKM